MGLGALADIHATLVGLDPKAVGALKHLPGIRKALVVIAKGQDEMLDLLENGPTGGGASGEEQDQEDDDGEEDDEDSDLEDAVEGEGNEVEEEDHGQVDTAALVPEVWTRWQSRRGRGSPCP